jgi:hypothetical protein
VTSIRLQWMGFMILWAVYGYPPLIKGDTVRYDANRSSKELLPLTHRAVIGLIQEIVSKI